MVLRNDAILPTTSLHGPTTQKTRVSINVTVITVRNFNFKYFMYSLWCTAFDVK